MTGTAFPLALGKLAGPLGAGLGSAGLLAILASAGLEVFGLGTPGIGVQQIALALAGFLALVLRDWLRQSDAAAWTDASRYLLIAVQVGALTLILAAWRIEGPGLYRQLFPIAFYGFLLHHALPARLRPVFFLLLSLLAIGMVLGPVPGALLLGVGLVLLGVCHLRLPYLARVAILVVLGIALGLARAELLPWNLPGAIWPVLASMFMFRVIVYLYDLRHGNVPPQLAQRLSYFFMLPNVVFPLFPVVDSTTYHKRYYDAPAYAIYQQGVGWILRGFLHLVAYRFLYQQLTIAPSEVADSGDLARYFLTTFGLYLRVSGQFHLIVGVLHLFGHRLPETHRLYFLASSFTDFWRRINIYWKDFIQKIVFYPTYFRLRRAPAVFRLVVATLVAFFATWLLHSYQWFWILGEPLFAATDVLFWTILAGLVVVNSLIERARGRVRKLDERQWSLREILRLSLRTAATFIVICLLWALWNSTSLSEWTALFGAVEWGSARPYALLGAFFGLCVLLAALSRWFTAVAVRLGGSERETPFGRQVALAGLVLAVLGLATSPALVARTSGRVEAVLSDLRSGNLNPRDADLLNRGYYENLMAVNLNSRLWEFYAQKPADWQVIAETPAGRSTGDFRDKELVPGASITFHGAAFEVNRWGMRDQDYEREPAAGTYRIAMLGASYALGSGVAKHESFEWLIETRLNAAGDQRFEILNFAVPGYTPTQHILTMEERVVTFAPDAVWLISYNRESLDIVHHMVKMLRTGVELPFDYLRETVEAVGIVPGMSDAEATRRLMPRHLELLAWTYRRIAERCRAHGIRPVWIFLPDTRVVRPEQALREQLPLALAAGFDLLELSTVYDGHPLERITIAPYDSHPNPHGHQIIADRLYSLLAARPDLLRSTAP